MGRVADSVIKIESPVDDNFFKYGFMFLEPFHHMTDKEMDVMASFAKHRYELGKSIKDDALLDRFLFSEEVKRQIRDELGMTANNFQVVMGKFKKKGVMLDGKINPKLLPNLSYDNPECYKLMLYFKL